MDPSILLSELQYKAVRSSGPGGQNVNKVASKVVLSFDVENSEGLSAEEKERVKLKLQSRLTSENILMLSADDDRSQLKNKAIVTQRFLEVMEKALIVVKARKKTKVPKAVVEKRLAHKKSVSAIKQSRKKPNLGTSQSGD